MPRLIAKSSVLYQSRMYSPGDPLPANDPVMRDAWLEAGTAVLADDTEEAAEGNGMPALDKDMKLAALQQIAVSYGVDASKMQKKADVIAAIQAAIVSQ
ncbi:MAG: hypothetical protein CVU91_07395 [Firmicutes bacterium HGW-Firmicutes-16]|nr:MAG: hypothetical protein CVU91_07395 [Firmicutes bacterium HGW-Firmicutes-16]